MKKRREEKDNTTLLTNRLSLKTFLITLLSLILLFSISCSNEDKTGGGKTFASYAGNWWGDLEDTGTETHFITINTDGSMVIHAGASGDVSIPSSSITKNSDTSYTATFAVDGEGSGQYNFNFSSDTQGTVGAIGKSIPITKK